MMTYRSARCGECGGKTVAPTADSARPSGVCSRCWRQTPEYRSLEAVRRSERYSSAQGYREPEHTRARTRYERRLRGLCLECGGRTRPPQAGVPRPLGLCASCWRLTPEFRERERKRESYRRDEALAERTRIRTSDRYRRLVDDEPEFRERERERQRQRWAGDPEYRARRAARRRQRYASDAEFRERERRRKREGQRGP